MCNTPILFFVHRNLTKMLTKTIDKRIYYTRIEKVLNTFQKAERNRFFAFCQNLRLPEVVCVVKLIRTIYLIINVFCYVECASFKFRNYIEMFIVACRRLQLRISIMNVLFVSIKNGCEEIFQTSGLEDFYFWNIFGRSKERSNSILHIINFWYRFIKRYFMLIFCSNHIIIVNYFYNTRNGMI